MTATRQVVLRCDAGGCPATFVSTAPAVRQARRDAEFQGWSTHDNRDYCAGHYGVRTPRFRKAR